MSLSYIPNIGFEAKISPQKKPGLFSAGFQAGLGEEPGGSARIIHGAPKRVIAVRVVS